MTALEFVSPRPARAGSFVPRLRSPLERALHDAPSWVEDLSLTVAKFEVRGDLGSLDGDVVRITPQRALVLAPARDAETVDAKLRRTGAHVSDVTGALAGLRVSGSRAATLMRRVTDLDLEQLPAAGAVAHVPAVVRRRGDAYELYWPQEYGHYLAHVVVDAARGIA